MTDARPPDDESVEYRQHRFTRPPGSTELLLIRHGESAPVRPGIAIPARDGHDDPALDPVGEEQAERVGERLADEGLNAIYVSSLRRTHQTAAPLAKRLDLSPIEEPELREVFLGDWEGGSFRIHVEERHPTAVEMLSQGRWDVIPNAEPADGFAARVAGAVHRIAERHVDESVAIFTHGGVIAQVLSHASGGRPFAFMCDNASISHLVISGERWILRRYNDTTHLHAGFTTAAEPLT